MTFVGYHFIAVAFRGTKVLEFNGLEIGFGTVNIKSGILASFLFYWKELSCTKFLVMAFLFPLLCLGYLILPVVAYRQVKTSNADLAGYPGTRPSIKEILRAKSDQPSLQLLKWSLMAALVALLSIVPLLGLPGAALISLFEFFNLVPAHKLHGDKMWPIAIIISLVVPIGWPLSILLRNVLTVNWNFHKPGIVKIFIFIWLMICLGIVHLLI